MAFCAYRMKYKNREASLFGGRKTEEPRGKPPEQGKNQQQIKLNPHTGTGQESNPGHISGR